MTNQEILEKVLTEDEMSDMDSKKIQEILWKQHACHWEITKGYLNGMVGLQGAIYSGKKGDRWRELEEKISAFIKDVEGEGLHEYY